jgi:hypothetical protein
MVRGATIEDRLRELNRTDEYKSCFDSTVDRFDEKRGGLYYNGTTLALSHAAGTEPRVLCPASYHPKAELPRPRTVSPSPLRGYGFGSAIARGADRLDTTDTSIEAQTRGPKFSLKDEARLWLESAVSFAKGERFPRRRPCHTKGLNFNPGRGRQGGGKFQSIASSTSKGSDGSPQRYAAAFKGTARSGQGQGQAAQRQRQRRRCKELQEGAVGPGSCQTVSRPTPAYVLNRL